MKTGTIFVLFPLVGALGCASTPPGGPETAASTESATQPDVAAAKKHLADHVTYPASRDQVLAACAKTKEFTESEKVWFSQHLPEGNYESSDQVVKALQL